MSTHPVKKRGSTHFLTPKLLSALDKCKVSDRDAMHLIVATAEALNCDIKHFVLNRTSLQHSRKEFRQEKAKELQDNFLLKQMEFLVVHWDTKLLPYLSEHTKVDRLPVVVSFQGNTQLLGVPKIEAGTGKKQAEAVLHTLSEWGVTEKVQAVCCDTTAANTGCVNGACVLLEELMERDLLYLPCRHHIFEIVLRSVFMVKMNLPTSGPDVMIFKRFQETWPNINTAHFENGCEDTFVRTAIQDIRDDTVAFCLKCLNSLQDRDDYKELLELTIIFLGVLPPRGIVFKYPGAFHHARWMSKAIYCLKIFMFRKQFHLTVTEENAVRDICIFLVHSYVVTWFTAPNAIQAPLNDFMFLKKLVEYNDSLISSTALGKFCGHLWYLSPEAVALAFFDLGLPKDIKMNMVQAAIHGMDSEDSSVKRIVIRPMDVKNYISKDISQFVTRKTLAFFTRFGVSTDFLQTDPDEWEERDDYKKGLKIAAELSVTNDIAERGIKLIEEYNNILTKNESQKQFLLQVICDYRQRYPDSKKETLLNK